jgi:endonuclease/exonuclease/phosphatase family metal-dependent hydrolase
VTSESLRIGTWNIFGRRDYRADRTAERGAVHATLQRHPLNVLSLQEVHFYDGEPDQQLVRELRDAGLPHFAGLAFSESHLDRAAELGVGVASRIPLASQESIQLTRPDLRASVRGELWVLHDKGMVGSVLDVDRDHPLWVCSLHLFPFFEFGVGEGDTRVNRMWEEFWGHADVLAGRGDVVLAGDFNQQGREPAAQQFSSRPWRFCLGAGTETTLNGHSLDEIALSWSPPEPRTELVPTFSDHHLAIAHVQLRPQRGPVQAGHRTLRGVSAA